MLVACLCGVSVCVLVCVVVSVVSVSVSVSVCVSLVWCGCHRRCGVCLSGVVWWIVVDALSEAT